MTNLVPASEIEAKVGVRRHDELHYGRAVSAEQTVYILHSRQCLVSGIDLRQCEYSLALDEGVDLDDWEGHQDKPVALAIDFLLVPAAGDHS